MDSDPIPVDTWHHIAIVQDGTNATMYINGEVNQTNTGATAIPSNAVDMLIGKLRDSVRQTDLDRVNERVEEWGLEKYATKLDLKEYENQE